MSESITLTTPYTVDPRQASSLQVESLLLNWKDARIEVVLGNGAVQRKVEYTGVTATNLMVALNKANLTSNSLHRRIMTQLKTDGYLDGTIGGTPD